MNLLPLLIAGGVAAYYLSRGATPSNGLLVLRWTKRDVVEKNERTGQEARYSALFASDDDNRFVFRIKKIPTWHRKYKTTPYKLTIRDPKSAWEDPPIYQTFFRTITKAKTGAAKWYTKHGR